ncbi:hypothetical protein ACJ2A9_20105 [Anaerobacillus sp. MEB173]|uniref:hypothetical protein n=1 Tax=Anaerobacillus sp. MEB173 TaxID=3383345 RepID=UPI003F932253
MVKKYEPTISEGVYPSDGGWSKDNGRDILILSIPEFADLMNIEYNSYHYAWLYDKNLNAYIFCFRLDHGEERAVIFHAEHAGVLLTEEMAYQSFQIAITDASFENLTEKTSYLLLNEIELQRELAAGW